MSIQIYAIKKGTRMCENKQVDSQIAVTDSDIERLVYELYRLSAEE